MNNCNCKHVNYCKLNSSECTLEEEWKHFNQDKIMNYSTIEIAAMQGRPELDLKKEQEK